MPAMLLPLLIQFASVLLPLVAPIITNLTERLMATIGAKLPGPSKPLINAIAGAVLAGLTGGNPITGVVVAGLGNRVREAINKSNGP